MLAVPAPCACIVSAFPTAMNKPANTDVPEVIVAFKKKKKMFL